ncbi:HAD family phosphatase [Actinomycetaceae bacterium TAE3-ERU4]|nr:HAD family phosphatase [Actinomycetaceae bacterium TAE3-ERU4]
MKELLPAAVLLDMDGTSIDSEPFWIASEIALAASFGKNFSPEMGHQFIGTSLISTARWFKEWIPTEVADTELENRLLQHVAESMKTAEIVYRPGFFEILQVCRQAKIPVGLVTSSHRILVEALETKLPSGTFAVSVAGNEVKKHKPDPEPYLQAAQLLGVNPADCIAVEDSPSGIGAAVAAGTITVGIECMNPIEPNPLVTELSSLADLTLERMSQLCREAKIKRSQL